MQDIVYKSIGVLHTPYKEPKGAPIQPAGARDTEGVVELWPEYAEALADLEGFSHLILLYHFHLAGPYKPRVVPFMDTVSRGLFATRAPTRPNPIGLSVVRLVRVEPPRLYVLDADMVDGTPLLDVKPHVSAMVPPGEERIGWLEQGIATVAEQRADGRFSGES